MWHANRRPGSNSGVAMNNTAPMRTFNGSSKFPDNKWQPNGGGVSYRTADGKPSWIAMDGTRPAGEKPFTTDPPQFNYLIQADRNLPVAQQIPPVFLK